MKLEYFKQLDGVRAIAALMVMFFHFFGFFKLSGPVLSSLGKFAVFGQTGVSLFFVLSGFLITRILMATKESSNYFKDFYIRRALRIFPLYYLFLIIYYFFVPLLQQMPIAPAGKQFYFWIYLQNFAITFKWPSQGPKHFWSLAVEEHFYLIWPCLIYFLNKRGIKIAIATMMIIAIICRFILVKNGIEVFYFTFTRMDELLIGALLAVWEKEGVLKGSAKKFMLTFIIVLVPTMLIWFFVTGKSLPVVQVIKYNLLSLCYFCLVGFVISVDKQSGINRILSGRFLSFTGKISYGLYVYHPLCFALLAGFLKGAPILLSFMVCFGISYLVSFLSYQFFEAKFIALKKYFSYDRELAKA